MCFGMSGDVKVMWGSAEGAGLCIDWWNTLSASIPILQASLHLENGAKEEKLQKVERLRSPGSSWGINAVYG